MGVRVMNRENIFGRSGSAAVLNGLIHGGRGGGPERPQHRYTSGAVTAGYAHRRHQLDRIQDTATYHCSCGLVFQADVHTSVDCPHCGAGQAW